jgi:hypothetical protein
MTKKYKVRLETKVRCNVIVEMSDNAELEDIYDTAIVAAPSFYQSENWVRNYEMWFDEEWNLSEKNGVPFPPQELDPSTVEPH